MKEITHIFFDLDHTLWDFEKNSALAFESIFKNYQIDLSVQKFIETYSPINHEYWELFRKDLIDQKTLRYKRLKTTFDALQISVSDEMIEKLSVSYLEHLPQNNQLFEGTIETLDYLYPKYKLHIITNGFSKVQEHKLVNSDLKKYFQTITDSESVGFKKPNPIIFQHALEQANCKPKNALMIGDCLEADVQGALDAGMKAMYFNEKKTIVPEHIQAIDNLTELKMIL